MDAIDRRGSFAAAADELGRVPSALSYTMQNWRRNWTWCCLTAQVIARSSLTLEECCWSAGACCLKRRINSPPMLKPCRVVGKPT